MNGSSRRSLFYVNFYFMIGVTEDAADVPDVSEVLRLSVEVAVGGLHPYLHLEHVCHFI